MKKKSICPIQYWAGNLSNEKQLIKPAPKFNCQKKYREKKVADLNFSVTFHDQIWNFWGFSRVACVDKVQKEKEWFYKYEHIFA